MLSILIPIYNFNVVDFVTDLQSQASECNVDFEILCLDDGSTLFKVENKGVENLINVTYTELPENVGRSKIRNLLAEKAQYSNLLFLDCDSSTRDNQFVRRYIDNISPTDVIYGGRCYEEISPVDANTYFRWWYGVQRETISVGQRLKQPYHSFMTNNFLIPKSVYLAIKLDESLKGYGHEDTLFGLELKKRGVVIEHIQNPLCHVGLESLEEYFSKTEEGIRNLKSLIGAKKIDDSVKLFRFYNLLKRFGLKTIIFNYYAKNKLTILQRLDKKEPNLMWFDLYKLGYLISLTKS
mgnify:CR=1 FL=1